jgi:hypothetical protein
MEIMFQFFQLGMRFSWFFPEGYEESDQYPR